MLPKPPPNSPQARDGQTPRQSIHLFMTLDEKALSRSLHPACRAASRQSGGFGCSVATESFRGSRVRRRTSVPSQRLMRAFTRVPKPSVVSVISLGKSFTQSGANSSIGQPPTLSRSFSLGLGAVMAPWSTSAVGQRTKPTLGRVRTSRHLSFDMHASHHFQYSSAPGWR